MNIHCPTLIFNITSHSIVTKQRELHNFYPWELKEISFMMWIYDKYLFSCIFNSNICDAQSCFDLKTPAIYLHESILHY